MDDRRSQIAVDNARGMGLASQVAVLHEVVDADASRGSVIGGGPDTGYDLITAVCAIRVLVAPPAHYATASTSGGSVVTESPNEAVARRYRQLFQLSLHSLRPGGHLIIGDHTGTLGLYDQMRLLEGAGFVEVDCAWRSRDWFVCGGRHPI